MLKKYQLLVIFVVSTFSVGSQADDIVNIGECRGFRVSECREIRDGIYSKNQPIFCRKNYAKELSNKEKTICEARQNRQQQLAESPNDRRQKEYLDDQAALLKKEFGPLLLLVETMAALSNCNMTEPRSTNLAIAQIHAHMNELVFRSRIGPEQGIYSEDLVRLAMTRGEEKATKQWCSSVTPEARAAVRNSIQSLNRAAY